MSDHTTFVHSNNILVSEADIRRDPFFRALLEFYTKVIEAQMRESLLVKPQKNRPKYTGTLRTLRTLLKIYT